MKFGGYLLKNQSGKAFPHNCIVEYKSNPNQQLDSKSWRDQLGDLHRTVLPHKKSKVWINTKPLSFDEKVAIQKVFGTDFGAAREACTVTYWNDEINDYSAAKVYIPDIDWTITSIASGEPKYAPITITLIEY